MKVVILHYHLNQGGVTRVIAHHLRSLSQAVEANNRLADVLLLHGPGDNGWDPHLEEGLASLSIRRRECSALAYDPPNTPAVPAPDELAEQIRSVMRDEGFGPDQTVIHTHNHTLGKNISLPGAIARWADDGYAVLNQIHDFAEDFRPVNFRRLRDAGFSGLNPTAADTLYPQAERIHYAVLNGRDRELLQLAGVDEKRLHWLPNPVPSSGDRPTASSARRELRRRVGIETDKRYLLYPVRAIRRKNVGEALLWSALAGPGGAVGISLPATSPTETPFYERWRSIGQSLGLPIWFDVGQATGLTLAMNLAAADAILTTSLAEGFGMVFLEAWLARRPLVGRDLPDITADFRDVGLEFPGLYQQLRIPADLVERQGFVSAWCETYARVRNTFQLDPYSEEQIKQQAELKLANGVIDFGDLDETRQEKVLERVVADDGVRQQILALNPIVQQTWFDQNLDTDATKQLIERNAQTIGTHFGTLQFGELLWSVYEGLLASPRSGLSPMSQQATLLTTLLGPERFRMIRA